MNAELATSYDWHDSQCGGSETTGFDGQPLSIPCDCGMPDLFRQAFLDGKRSVLDERGQCGRTDHVVTVEGRQIEFICDRPMRHDGQHHAFADNGVECRW